MAAAGCSADGVLQGSGQVRCQDAEFILIRLLVRDEFNDFGRVERGEDCVGAVTGEGQKATAEEASLLGIQKAALITHIRRTYYSDQGQPVETADIVIPAALCEIVYEIPVGR